MRKRRILICGATGFIGTNLFKFLSKNDEWDVWGTCYGSPGEDKVFKVDLRDREKVRSLIQNKKIDTVLHAAAVTDGLGAVQAHPTQYIADNIIINTNIAEAAHLGNVSHLIFMSCTVMYPSKPTPQKEEEADLSCVHPHYFMGARIKTYMEDLCKFYSEYGDTKFTMVRHANIYGPHDKFSEQKGHVFAATIAKILAAQQGENLVVWGEGKERRDFLYISDLLNFIEMVLDKKFDPRYRYNIFNVGSGVGVSIAELVEKIVDISGKNLKIQYDKSRPSLGNQIIIDSSKTHRIIGWYPSVNLDEGIRKTLAWCNGLTV